MAPTENPALCGGVNAQQALFPSWKPRPLSCPLCVSKGRVCLIQWNVDLKICKLCCGNADCGEAGVYPMCGSALECSTNHNVLDMKVTCAESPSEQFPVGCMASPLPPPPPPGDNRVCSTSL